jgi:hypothetical protein
MASDITRLYHFRVIIAMNMQLPLLALACIVLASFANAWNLNSAPASNPAVANDVPSFDLSFFESSSLLESLVGAPRPHNNLTLIKVSPRLEP